MCPILQGQAVGSPQTLPAPFLIVIEPRGTTVVVAPVGELDIATAPELGSRLALLRADFGRIVLDLRRVRFMGCAGLRVVLEADAAARSGHGILQLVKGPAGVRRLFALAELTGLQYVEPLSP